RLFVVGAEKRFLTRTLEGDARRRPFGDTCRACEGVDTRQQGLEDSDRLVVTAERAKGHTLPETDVVGEERVAAGRIDPGLGGVEAFGGGFQRLERIERSLG